MLGVLIFAAIFATAFSLPDGNLDVWQYIHKLEDKVNRVDERVNLCESEVKQTKHDVKQTKQMTKSMLQDMDERVRKLDVPVIAFTASTSISRDIAVGQKLLFDLVQINEGNGYNAATGVFTCPETGWYLFSASILSQNEQKAHYGVVVGETVVSKQYSRGITHGSSSAPVAAYCAAGTQVWLEAIAETCRYHAASWGNSVFTGILVNQRV